MSTWGSDPSATRSPSEGGWFRFGAELADPGAATGETDAAPQATWNPIPDFRPADPDLAYGLVAGQVRTAGHLPALPRPPGWPAGAPRRRLPETAVDYPRLLRGPTRAWWRPILCLALFAGLVAVLMVAAVAVTALYGVATGVENLELWLDAQLAEEGLGEPGGYLFLNLTLIIAIPAAMLSVWAVHRIRPRFLSSVAGGLRWRWLLRCLVVLSPVWAVYLAVSTVTDPPQSPRPEQWLVLLIMGLIMTPWQAAAEEYAFRGWLTQNLGAYFARPALAFVVPTVIAAGLFAVGHGSPDPWILADLAVFSVVASILTWRTGGLEAAIVLHAVNNVGIDIIVTTVGGFDEALVGAETTGTPLSFGVSLLVHAVALALVLWQARRSGVDRWFRPPAGRLDQPASAAFARSAC